MQHCHTYEDASYITYIFLFLIYSRFMAYLDLSLYFSVEGGGVTVVDCTEVQ